MITFYVGFILVFLMLLWLCPFFKNQIVFDMGLSCDFFVFYYFFFQNLNINGYLKKSSFICCLQKLTSLIFRKLFVNWWQIPF